MKAAIFRKSMKNSLVSIVMIGSLFIFTNKVLAADLTQQEPTLITMKIGTTDGQHKFSPDAITLETGKLYKLRLENTGVQPYYFARAV